MPSKPPTEGFTYDPELTPGYFIQIRSDFLRYGGFTPAAKVLYEVLLTYAGEGTTAWPGQLTLAGHLGVSERTIRTVLNEELVPAGLVSVRRHGQGHPNTYHLHKLQTLPPKVRPAKSAGQERQHLPGKNGRILRSRAAPIADEVQSVETQPDQIQESGNGRIIAPDAFAVQRGEAPSRATLPGEARRG